MQKQNEWKIITCSPLTGKLVIFEAGYSIIMLDIIRKELLQLK